MLSDSIHRLAAGYFHILESFIIKSRHKTFFPFSFQYKNIRLKRIRIIRRPVMHIDIRLIHPAVFIQPFSMPQLHNGACFPFYLYCAYTGDISSEIKHICGIIESCETILQLSYPHASSDALSAPRYYSWAPTGI